MKERRLIPYQNGYEPFVDFLKGYMILCILFTHACNVWEPLRDYSMFYLWACAPTGCFLLISTMHFYRNGVGGRRINIGKHVKKVLLPFGVAQIVIVLGIIIFKSLHHFDSEKIITLIKAGGYGVGSYFPWVYIQYILVMILITPIIKIFLKNKIILLLLFVFLSVAIEVICSIFDMDDGWYRVTVLRYPFLIYLGLELDCKGIYLSKKRIVASLIGLFFVLIFACWHVNLEPVFYDTCWNTYHWVCYLYMAYFLVYVLYRIFLWQKENKFNHCIIRIGKASYGIFLFQSFFYLIPIELLNNNIVAIVLFIPFSMIFCSIGGILLKEKVLDVCIT